MSDYGDDYSDYGDDWFYVEDEYMAADDLAEHAVASPPPTTYEDEDMQPDWDRFDYFNDLEYASDGYDDATFQVHNAKGTNIGQKRKRVARSNGRRKRRRTEGDTEETAGTHGIAPSPIVWRSQKDREKKPRLIDENAKPYSLLKDWRETLPTTPVWAHGSPSADSPSTQVIENSKARTAPPKAMSPTSELLDEPTLAEGEEMEGDDGESGVEISQDALMAALQRQLAAAGGPLSGMDPQQLLQFAMRMATDKDAGDDIAGEMADAMLEGEEDEDETDAENLLSWVAQQRNANKKVADPEPKSPDATRNSNRPPTPPSSEANRSVHTADKPTQSNESAPKTRSAKETRPPASLKRKADPEEDNVETSSKATKKRATRSFDAPTAASQARAAPARTTRSTRSKG